jgi:hypothetical protein
VGEREEVRTKEKGEVCVCIYVYVCEEEEKKSKEEEKGKEKLKDKVETKEKGDDTQTMAMQSTVSWMMKERREGKGKDLPFIPTSRAGRASRSTRVHHEKASRCAGSMH